MTNGDLNRIAGFIWNIADGALRDVSVRGIYRDVIFPMTVIRRPDAVLKLIKQLDEADVANKHVDLAVSFIHRTSSNYTCPVKVRVIDKR